jgi:ParB family chromosome partitioning protein
MSTQTLERPSPNIFGDPSAFFAAAKNAVDPRPIITPDLTMEQMGQAHELALRVGAAWIAPELIDPNPFQPRRSFPEKEIEELADSISEDGILNRPKVRPHPTDPGRFQMVDGERRKRAVAWLNDDGERRFGPLPCTVEKVADEDMLKLALDADALHKHFNPIERAWGYAKLEEMGWTQERIGQRYGIGQSAVSNFVRMLKLPDESTPVAVVGREVQWNNVQALIATGRLDAAHGIALCGVADDPEACRDFAQKAVEGEWTQKALVEELKAYRDEKERERQPALIEAEESSDEEDESTPISNQEDSATSELIGTKNTAREIADDLEGRPDLLTTLFQRWLDVRPDNEERAILCAVGDGYIVFESDAKFLNNEMGCALRTFKHKGLDRDVQYCVLHRRDEFVYGETFLRAGVKAFTLEKDESAKFLNREASTSLPESSAEKSSASEASSPTLPAAEQKTPAAKKDGFEAGAGVQWLDGNSHAKTGKIAEVGKAIYWVQPTGTSGASKRKEFKKKNCILRPWDGKSVPTVSKANATPAPSTNSTAKATDEKAKSTPAASTPAPAKAEPRKAPEGFTPTFAPTDAMFECEDAGLSVVDVYTAAKRLIALAAMRSISVDEYLTALETEE